MMVWMFVALKLTELSGGRVHTLLLKASGGVATLVILIDTVAAWKSKDSLEYEADVLRLASCSVASIGMIVGLIVGMVVVNRDAVELEAGRNDVRNPRLRRSEAAITYNATSAIQNATTLPRTYQ